MDDKTTQDAELVELGVATVETRGLSVLPMTDFIGDRNHAGLSHE